MKQTLSRSAIRAVLLDLIDQEFQAARGRSIRNHPAWIGRGPLDELSLGEEGLSLDSMELLTAAGVVNEFFHLYETGVEDYLLRRRGLEEWVEVVSHALEEGTSGVTFRTSGSTGEPKTVFKSWEALHQEIDFLADLFGCRRKILSTVPAHHIYGFLFTVLLPERADLPVERFYWEDLGSLPNRTEARDLIVSHPALWRFLQRSVARWGSAIWGVSSTAPLPEELHEEIYKAGMERLIEVFGSTETGGIGFRERGGSPFTLFPHFARDRDASRLLRQEPGGSSWTPVEAMDSLQWEDDRRFLPQGRRDHAIQIGGEKVHMERVESVIASVPGVEEVAVRRHGRDPDTRLKAFVVLSPGAAVDVQSLEATCRRRLRSVECPTSFTVGESLPRNRLGKLADWAV